MKRADRRTFLRTAVATAVLMCVPSFTGAAPPDNRPKKAKGHQKHSDYDTAGAFISAGITAAVARDLFRQSGGHPGMYKPLPPGIQKNLARGKPIPPGIARNRLPGGYIGRLPAHAGYEWIGAGSDLLLIQVVSGVIADILIDVFR